MADELLKTKIKLLASKMQKQHELDIDFHYFGSPNLNLLKKGSVHRVKSKKKYTYIDYGIEQNQSGKLLVENQTGNVFGIKGYGKKGRYEGTIDQAIATTDNNISQLLNALKSKKNKGHGSYSLKDYNGNKTLVGVG